MSQQTITCTCKECQLQFTATIKVVPPEHADSDETLFSWCPNCESPIDTAVNAS